MLWGIKFYNDLLMQAGPLGNVQSELLFRKDSSTFTFEKGWAFPRRIYFNGDNCVMPPPDTYPWLPNASPRPNFSLLTTTLTLLSALAFLYTHAWGLRSMLSRTWRNTWKNPNGFWFQQLAFGKPEWQACWRLAAQSPFRRDELCCLSYD